MGDYYFRTENFNEEVMQKFAEFLKANDFYVIKSRPHTKEVFTLPSEPEKREELLVKITNALNDGFYSNDSCIAYLYELFRSYQVEIEEKTKKENIFLKNFDKSK
ncbi:MAG: hypothetical protein IK048_04515 [Clostridia bacterium]|nr:hypothetical protein [Clostridia bacterium]